MDTDYSHIYQFSFERLNVYVVARKLVKGIYNLQKQFPAEEKYALGDQIRRSAASIVSNIAEGSGRESIKEKIRFLEIAFGSMTESFSQLQIAEDLGYIASSDIDELRPLFQDTAKMLSGLRNSFLKKINSQ